MIDSIRLERLHVYLNRVMDDGQIVANPRFNATGMGKIAKHMGVEVEDVPALISQLAEHLRSLTEGDNDEPRFTYEEDTLGGITVRDTETGQEKFLSVQQAAALMKELSGPNGTEQETLERAMNESREIRELSADDMGSENSIFNFPWRLNESAGFAAAQYSGFGHNFTMKIVSVVDHEGNPVDNIDTDSLNRIARDFINEA